MRRSLVLLLLLGSALASDLDARGWKKGTMAAQATRVLTPIQDDIRIDLPKDFVKSLNRPTLVVYFSPTCPHCTAVTPELDDLRESIADKADLVLIATRSSTQGQLAEYRRTYGVGARIVHDEDGEFGAALGARSTPSAALVVATGASKTEVKMIDAWYPYVPGFDVLVQMRLSPEDPFAVFEKGAYQGLNACGSCHLFEAQSWQITHHGAAWATLMRKESHTDPECQRCHVTGAGQPGGWTESNAQMVDVQCEACHGPGGPHDGEATDPRTTCEGCHDEKHSIAFTYEKGLPLIDHYAAEGMTDDAFMKTRRALFEGEMPRPLLAWGEGKNVGAEACKSCHEKEHAAWMGSDHQLAMETLVKDNASEKVECVRCHATARQTGPAPTNLLEYRAEDGVGCESCHGPGEAHVAAGGGTDNIERLGDDCPMCVIESVCTNCHTKKWDENWDLDRDLLRVKGHRIVPLDELPK